MKKRISWIAFVLALVLLVGTAVPASAASAGSWKINGQIGNYLSKAEQKVFNKAVEKLTGVAYTPVFTLATQVVAGTNYAFFCKAVTATAKPRTTWKVLIVNENLKGKVKLMKVNSFNYKNPKTLDSAYFADELSGGWTGNTKAVKTKGIPSAAKKALKKATEGYVGLSLTGLVLLGTQVVAGTNYSFLCLGTTSDRDATTCLYHVIVYQDPDGECSITECSIINLPKYLAY